MPISNAGITAASIITLDVINVIRYYTHL